MPWARKRFRNQKIHVEVNEQGQIVIDARSMARYRYKLDDDRTYTTSIENIRELDGALPERSEPVPYHAPLAPGSPASGSATPGDTSSPAGGRAAVAEPGPLKVSTINNPSPVDELMPAGTEHIEVYTDGACTGNPGPAGLGVVLRFGPYHREIHQYLGLATNNIAELTAIKVALEAIKNPRKKVLVHTDSQYAIGVLTGAYKAKKNQDLIRDIQRLMRGFDDLQLVKVAGHSGIPQNERVDELARMAIAEGTGGPMPER